MSSVDHVGSTRLLQKCIFSTSYGLQFVGMRKDQSVYVLMLEESE